MKFVQNQIVKKDKYVYRPIYVEFCILKMSKVFVYQFHFVFVKPKYGENASLLFTDTDSIYYSI